MQHAHTHTRTHAEVEEKEEVDELSALPAGKGGAAQLISPSTAENSTLGPDQEDEKTALLPELQEPKVEVAKAVKKTATKRKRSKRLQAQPEEEPQIMAVLGAVARDSTNGGMSVVNQRTS